MVNARQVDGRFSLILVIRVCFDIRDSIFEFYPAAAETKRPNKFASPTNGSGNAAGCPLTWVPRSRIF
jgi:hypothetical protein